MMTKFPFLGEWSKYCKNKNMFFCLQDKWLLHAVLILIQSWIDPLADLQVSLESYDNAPSVLLNRTKWLYTKLLSLEQGVLILIKQVRMNVWTCESIRVDLTYFTIEVILSLSDTGRRWFAVGRSWKSFWSLGLRWRLWVCEKRLQCALLLQERRSQNGNVPQTAEMPADRQAKLLRFLERKNDAKTHLPNYLLTDTMPQLFLFAQYKSHMIFLHMRAYLFMN